MLAERSHLTAVVTQPDRPAGRGHKLSQSPVKALAIELGIPVYEPSSLRDFATHVQPSAHDVFVLASYGKVLPRELLDRSRLGALNVHPSLLPKYRGATPIQAALLAGDAETGVTIMLMDAGMDTGDVVLQERTPIAPDETYGELHDRLARFGALALSHALDLASSGYITHTAQRGEVSVTRPVRKSDLFIDWHESTQRIVNRVRAYSPRPAARATVAGIELKVLRARRGPAVIVGGLPGEIAGISGDALRVFGGDGLVELLQVVAPSRGVQTGSVFAQSISAGRS